MMNRALLFPLLLTLACGETLDGGMEADDASVGGKADDADADADALAHIEPGPIGETVESCGVGMSTAAPGAATALAREVHPELRAELTSHYQELNETCIHWVTAGDPDDDPVVMLHGYPQFWVTWAKMVDIFVDAGYFVIIPDVRGVNESARPDDPTTYHQINLARDVITLMERYRREWGADVPFDVMSYDTGGMTGWYLASHPGDYVRRITISNFPHPTLYREDLLLRSREARSWSQYPLSYFVFGQAYIPDLAQSYFFEEGLFKPLSWVKPDDEHVEDIDWLQDQTLHVPAHMTRSGEPEALRFSEASSFFAFRTKRYAKRYRKIFERLNFEMRLMRMSFDEDTGRPRALVTDDPSLSPISRAEVKLYTDAMMWNFHEDDNQIQDWFRAFVAMTLQQGDDTGFLWVPDEEREFVGRYTAICSIVERDLFGRRDDGVRLGLYSGELHLFDAAVQALTEALFLTECDDPRIEDGIGSPEDDPFALPEVRIPTAMFWGHHDAYLNTTNFTRIGRYAPLVRGGLLRLHELGGAGETDDAGYPLGSHWSIDEFPGRIADESIAFFSEGR